MVQQQVTVGDGDQATQMWDDIATVTGPARRKRRTVIREALREARLLSVQGLKVRVLDQDAAHVFTVGQKPPAEPELDIR